jgi:hypothetical protein
LRHSALRDRASGFLVERGGAVFLVVLVTYLWLAPATVVDGDNAEFAALGALGGRAHPPGYPLYVLYLRAMSWLPGENPAHVASLATAILGALIVLVLHAACRAWGARPLAASLVVAVYAATPLVVRTHIEAEVFALNALLVSMVLWLAASKGPVRGLWRGVLLGLVAGLGLANHTTCVLIAPVGLLGAVRAIRESDRRVTVAALSIVGLAFGLLPYAYLYVADSPVSWGEVTTFGDGWAFFTRENYGGVGAFVAEGEVPLAGQLLLFVETMTRGWLGIGLLIGLVTFGYGIARGAGSESRWAWMLFAASWLVAGPLLVTRFNLQLDTFGLYACRRFHLLPLVMLAIPVAIGTDRIGAWLAARVQLTRLARVGPVLVCLIFLGLTTTTLSRLRAQHSPASERQVLYMLQSMPPRAIVVVAADDLHFTSTYLQAVRGVRPDVTVVSWLLIPDRWWRMFREGLFLTEYTRPIGSRQVLLWMMMTRRPIFLEPGTSLSTYPFGFVERVLEIEKPPPTVHEVLEINRALYETFTIDYPHPGRDDDWATVVHQRYARAWLYLAIKLFEVGAVAEATAARDIGRAYGPRGDD